MGENSEKRWMCLHGSWDEHTRGWGEGMRRLFEQSFDCDAYIGGAKFSALQMMVECTTGEVHVSAARAGGVKSVGAA